MTCGNYTTMSTQPNPSKRIYCVYAPISEVVVHDIHERRLLAEDEYAVPTGCDACMEADSIVGANSKAR